jgi:WD40 repeat protein
MYSRHFLMGLVLLLPPLARAAAPPGIQIDHQGDRLPAGAWARLGTVRLRPSEPGGPVVLAPDGRSLFTGEPFGVRQWDLTTGRQVRTFEPGMALVQNLHLSADGAWLAVVGSENGLLAVTPDGGGQTVCVLDINSGRARALEVEASHCILGLRFVPGNRFLLGRLSKSGEQWPGGRVVLWDIASGKVSRALGSARAHALSPDGRSLALAEEGTIRILEVATGREKAVLRSPEAQIGSLAFSPDGRSLASGGWSRVESTPGTFSWDSSLRLWDLTINRQSSGWKRSLGAALPFGCQVAFAADGRTLLGEHMFGYLVIVDTKTRAVVHAWRSDGLLQTSSALSPDGKRVLWTPDGRTVLLTELDSGKARHTWSVAPGTVRSLAFSKDGRKVIVGAPWVSIRDVETGRELHHHEGHRQPPVVLRFSPDGRTLASLDEGLALRLWDLRTGTPLPPFRGPTPWLARRFSFLDGGRRLTTLGYPEPIVRLHDIAGWREVQRFSAAKTSVQDRWQEITGGATDNAWPDAWPAWCAVFSRDGRQVAVVQEDGSVGLHEVGSGRRIARLEANQGRLATLHFSPDGRWLVTASIGHSLRLWDTQTGKLVDQRRWVKDRSLTPVVTFSPDSRLLAWGVDNSFTVRHLDRDREGVRFDFSAEHVVFDTREGVLFEAKGENLSLRRTDTGRVLRPLNWPAPDTSVSGLETAPDGRVVVRLSLDHKHSRSSLRDALTGRELAVVRGGEPWAFSPDGRILALIDGELEFREVATGGLLGRVPHGHRGFVTVLGFSPDGRTLVTGSRDTSLLVWDWPELCGSEPAGDPAVSMGDLWRDLASADARVGQRAVGLLVRRGNRAVETLRGLMRPVTEEECRPVRRLLADLDSDEFQTRQKAQDGLSRLHVEWLPLFEAVLEARPSLEVKRRVEVLLRKQRYAWSPEMLRRLRAVQVLERIGSAEAERLLEALERGLAWSCLTRDARAARERLAQRRSTRVEP